MARKMRDDVYRQEQYSGLYQPHVARINRLVDEIRTADAFVPYVAPINGGVDARLLAISRDPGPMTQRGIGSGMLSIENDDPSAERYSTFLAGANIDVKQLTPWNIYPWYINANPTTKQLEDGLEPLRRLIGLLPHLKVVMVHGGAAQNGWRRFAKVHPEIASRFSLIKTYHTSRQALRHKDPAVRAARENKLRTDFAEAATLLRG